jgi:Protein of unknown function (DUF2975)
MEKRADRSASPGRIPPVNSRLCRRVGTAAALSGIALLCINATMWLVPEMAPYAARGGANLQDEPITLTPVIRTIGLAGSTLHLVILAWGLFVARALLRRLADGLVFEPETGQLLRRFGMSLVVYAALQPPVATGMAWLVTKLNPPGERLLRFGLTDHEIVLAIVGVLILTTGSVLAEATRIAEENRQIV